MKTPLDYFALVIALLPVSAVLACVLCAAWDEHRHWNSGNTRRPNAWHRQGRTAATQHRTHR